MRFLYVCAQEKTRATVWFKNSLSNSISVLMYNRWKLQHHLFFIFFLIFQFFLNDLTINSLFQEKKHDKWERKGG